MAERNNLLTRRKLQKPANSAFGSKVWFERFNPLTQASFFVFNFVVAALQYFKIRFLHDERDNVRFKGNCIIIFL